MNKSLWGVLVIMLGVASVFFIVLFQTITNTDDREKFVENFVRRFAESAHTGRKYHIEIIDVNEAPPKVSIRVSSGVSGSPAAMLGDDQTFTFDIDNSIDAIMETPY